MKKLLFSFSLVFLGFTGSAINASAQRYDPRVDVSRLAVDESRAYRGDREDREFGRDDRRSSRVTFDLDGLNREVRQVRVLIGDPRRVGQRIRDRFHRVMDATDNLNNQFRRGTMRGWEVRRRADLIRGELDRIRLELRAARWVQRALARDGRDASKAWATQV